MVVFRTIFFCPLIAFHPIIRQDLESVIIIIVADKREPPTPANFRDQRCRLLQLSNYHAGCVGSFSLSL
jgi:hypothetical protein